jgi:menaquinol-cytochrome c reductase iron-sulfur subunit
LTPIADPESPGRRRILARAVQALGAAIAAALALPALAYLFAPGRRPSAGAWVVAGSLATLSPGNPEEVGFLRTRVDGWKIVNEKATAWLVRLGDNEVAAFSPQCTHLGCAYHYDAGLREFVCPCHASNFSLTGQVLTGPAPRPLDRYPVRLDGDRILIGELPPPTESAT